MPAGGGADSKFGYAESNENSVPYGLLKHVHMPEMAKTNERLIVHVSGDFKRDAVAQIGERAISLLRYPVR